MSSIFDVEEPDPAKRARNIGMARVTANGGRWIDTAVAAVRALPAFEGTGEELRLLLLANGLVPPHHHNAWGPLVKSCWRKHKLLQLTGQRRCMETERSHARVTDVYRKVP